MHVQSVPASPLVKTGSARSPRGRNLPGRRVGFHQAPSRRRL